MSSPLQSCKYCRGVTLESLSNGYLHAPNRAALVRSTQKCRFCSLLFRKDRSRDNGQLFLKLGPYNNHDNQICLKLSHLGPGSQPEEQLSFFLYTSLGMFIFPLHSLDTKGSSANRAILVPTRLSILSPKTQGFHT